MKIALVIGLFLLIIILMLNEKKKISFCIEKEDTSIFKGLLAIGVILHHLSQALCGYSKIFDKFIYLGNLFVGSFFLLSGYGLIKSYFKKKDYKKNFFKKRIPQLIIPFVVVSIFLFITELCFGIDLSIKSFLLSFINLKPFISFCWYVYVILFIYIVFGLTIKFIKNPIVINTLISILVLIVVVICKINIVSYWWYHGILAFPIGLWLGLYDEKIFKIINKKYIRYTVTFFVSFVLISIYLDMGNYYLNMYSSIILELLQIVMFSMFVLCIFMRYTLNQNVFKVVGDISYEMYLCQSITFFMLPKFFNIQKFGASLYIVAAVIFTILIAKIFNILDKWIISKYNKKLHLNK